LALAMVCRGLRLTAITMPVILFYPLSALRRFPGVPPLDY
jgi:hypothetical protein